MAAVLRVKAAWRGGDADGRPGWFLELTLEDDWRSALDRFKRRIPSDDRDWNEGEKRWWVAAEHEPALASLLPGFEAYQKQGSLW